MRGIISIVIGIVFIIGGLTGSMVLVGTNSSMGLVAVGVVIALIGVARVARRS